MTLVACAVFLAPALIIIVCYTVIVCTIWSKSGAIVVANPHPRPKSVRGETSRLYYRVLVYVVVSSGATKRDNASTSTSI